MKIKIFILLTVYLYTINNYSESSNDKSSYYFYQKLSKIMINKDTTLEEIVEKTQRAYQQTSEEIYDENFTKYCEEQIGQLSNLLPERFKTFTFGNIARFLEKLGAQYRESDNLQKLKINYLINQKNFMKNSPNIQFDQFHQEVNANNLLPKDHLESPRLKNLFYGARIACIAFDENISAAMPTDISTNEIMHSDKNITYVGLIIATLFHHINIAHNSFDNQGNYISDKDNLDSQDYLDLYRLL